ncbi:ExeM/NucH family extracellular endonuclease [Marinobacter sp. BW6]|uniref:ExeM/NucH family extracellular endonuclease n=1 Tax=Marinobacter sp. BW6 TaxID=2592624 RepID=UPI0011DEB0F0|nr:ExeM/NucH family extracellular endonuclease [Marinobacter sp. BW6]TYC56745.1 ExeM/NucH family extracellular endonuclease [Marinobacter sp. BW6]
MNSETWRYSFLCVLILPFLPLVATAESACGKPATPISEVQGTDPASLLAGKTVTVEGILTQDSRSEGGFGGFYLQQADHETDNNPATSEALFVYTDRDIGKPGMRLRVTGKVKEYHGLTELVAVRDIRICGREALPAPSPLALPWTQDPEHLENMRVNFRQPLTVVDNYNLGRYGELALAAADQVQPTEHLPPGDDAYRASIRNRQNRVLLDDNRSIRNPRPIPWPPEGLSSTTVRAGDRIDELVGVLDFRFDAWRIQPTQTPVFLTTNPREPASGSLPDDPVRIVALNLGNFFNGDGQGGQFPTARGAATPAAFQRQQQRLVQTLLAPDPDILALTELENDGYGPHSAIASLAEALGSQWRFVSTPGQDGDDEIRTGMLYRSDRISAIGQPERLASGPFRSGGRPPLAQDFRRIDGDVTVRVVVPHLKSKSCRGARGDDQDQADGQGCYAARRTDEAQALAGWSSINAGGRNSAGTLIIGDLNSYAREQPIAVLKSAGFASMVHHFHPCTENTCHHYTYRYGGEKGSLDYALASTTLKPRVVGARSWLVNADEPRVLGYQSKRAAKRQGPWRSSDHNPVIVDLKL